MSQSELQSLQDWNRGVRERIQALVTTHQLNEVRRKFDSFAPANETERRRVKSYEDDKTALEATRRDEPFALNSPFTVYLEDHRHFTDAYHYQAADDGLRIDEVKATLRQNLHTLP